MQTALFVQQGREFKTGLKCSSCDLCKNPKLETNCMPGTGSKTATFMFVGHAPGEEDDRIGHAMTGDNGRLLRSLLSQAGFDLSDCYFTNCLKCCTHRRNPTATMWKSCKTHFLREVEQIKPRFIVSLGSEAMKFLTGQSGVSRLRRKAVPSDFDPDIKIYPLRQPASLNHAKGPEAAQLRQSMVEDLQHLYRRKFLDDTADQYDTEQELDYKVARTEEQALEMLDELEQYDRLACDLETTNLGKPQDHDAILMVGFSFGKGVGRAFPFDCRGVSSLRWWSDDFYHNVMRPRIKKLIETKDIFGQNFVQYDQMWLRGKLGIEKLEIKYDTLYAHYCINEEQGSHSLESQAMEFTSMSPWKSEFNPEDIEKTLGYLNKDVDATWRIREVIEPQLNDRQRWLLEQLLIPLAQELFEIEYRGVLVDSDSVNALDKYLTKRIEEVLKEIKEDEPVRKWELKNNQNFNPNSTKMLPDVLRNSYGVPLKKNPKSGNFSTDAAVLNEHGSKYPICAKVLSYRKLGKLKGTYVKGTLERMRSNRLHTSFNVTSTVTGRLSSSDPNLQNIPREDTAGAVLEDGSQIKKMFVPEEGYVFLQGDYQAMELRILACLANDPTMLQIFADGLDIHAASAAKVQGIPIEEVTKPLRTASKRLSFGIVYGMHEETLIEAFIDAGNTKEAGEEFLLQHKREFPNVWAYMDAQENLIRRDQIQTTFSGRSRRYDIINERAIRQAYNFPIQSTSSDITLLSLVRCARALRDGGYKSRVTLTVHDSIIFEIKIEEFWSATSLVCAIMEGVQFPWLTVPLKVDAEVGTSWGSLVPIDWRNQCFLEK